MSEDAKQTRQVVSPGDAIHTLLKSDGDRWYLFAVSAKNAPVEFEGVMPEAHGMAEVLWEGRHVEMDEGQFRDTFAAYEVHVYRPGRAQ